eukprot:m.30482 g.30482  ORF g.30482 m.30482 type:complete len:321 (+) comp9462_c0_seq1:89-1051(+)
MAATDASSSPSSGAASQTTLTEQQQKRMQTSRQQALSRKRRRQEAAFTTAASSVPAASSNLVPSLSARIALDPSALPGAGPAAGDGARPNGRAGSAKTAKPSWLHDTGAGFMLDEEQEDWEASVANAHRPRVVYEPGPEEYDQDTFCKQCSKPYLGSFLDKNFGVKVCDACRAAGRDTIWGMITKTEAKEEYLLRDEDLDGTKLRFIERKNPQNERWARVKLYLRSEVERVSYERYGGEQGLEDEIDRRITESRKRKQKKKVKEIAKLRRDTFKSVLRQKPVAKAHMHTFNPDDERYVEETDSWVKKCSTCDFEVSFEKM